MIYREKSDKELAKLLSFGEEDAFRELYIRYKDKIWYYCFCFLKSEEETNDIIQEVFIRLWEMREFINSELSISSFLFTITRNSVLNYLRDTDTRRRIKKALLLKVVYDGDKTDEQLIFSDYQQLLIEAIDKLPPKRKIIFNMSRNENLSHKEIASQLGISIHTVQEHISESLRFIKTYFAKNSDVILSTCIISILF